MTNYHYLEESLNKLEIAISSNSPNELEIDGIIYRFKYCYDLTWKYGRSYLKDFGICSTSPKSVFKELAKKNLIKNFDLWVQFLESRNLTVHAYNQILSNKIILTAKNFYPEAKALLDLMKKNVNF